MHVHNPGKDSEDRIRVADIENEEHGRLCCSWQLAVSTHHSAFSRCNSVLAEG